MIGDNRIRPKFLRVALGCLIESFSPLLSLHSGSLDLSHALSLRNQIEKRLDSLLLLLFPLFHVSSLPHVFPFIPSQALYFFVSLAFLTLSSFLNTMQCNFALPKISPLFYSTYRLSMILAVMIIIIWSPKIRSSKICVMTCVFLSKSLFKIFIQLLDVPRAS